MRRVTVIIESPQMCRELFSEVFSLTRIFEWIEIQWDKYNQLCDVLEVRSLMYLIYELLNFQLEEMNLQIISIKQQSSWRKKKIPFFNKPDFSFILSSGVFFVATIFAEELIKCWEISLSPTRRNLAELSSSRWKPFLASKSDHEWKKLK